MSTTSTTSAGTSTTTVVSTKRFDTGSITKLNSENYRVWKLRMVSIFKTHNSLDIVEGRKTRPTSGADAQARFDQADSEAFTAMLMAMEDSQVEAVSGCTTSNEIWAKLLTMYENSSGACKQSLWMQYYSVMTKDSPVLAMVEIQSLATQLRNLKEALSDEAVVSRVISSMLDERYRQFREAWRSV